jgi:hypothetical protein
VTGLFVMTSAQTPWSPSQARTSTPTTLEKVW